MTSSLLDVSTTILDSPIQAVGNTPLVYIHKICVGLPCQIACKLEYLNPACSVKDRIGFKMVESAEKSGLIRPGVTTLIEPTSGNTGIALAFVCAVKGYKLILTMPSSMSIERRVLIKAYGAEVFLTNPADGFAGVINRANDIQALIPNSYILNQFENPANIEAHYENTGPEIWRQTKGAVDICVFGVGTGGTLTGVGKFLKEKKPQVKMYAVEPFESSVLNGYLGGSHKIAGIGAGVVVPFVKDGNYEEALRVKGQDALQMAKKLAEEEGILAGISSGANICAALELARRPENAGKLIVTSIASFGERYLSSDLYADIKADCENMTFTSFDENRSYLKKKLKL